MRVGLALQPVVTALFANSPFTEGRPNGYQSYRAEIWRDTDPARTGMLPFAFEDGFGFERYVDWALDVPMYFVKRGDRYYDVTGTTFRAYLAGSLDDVLPDAQPTLADWKNHLSTLFPEVRLKNYLEMRGADGGPGRRICAVPALWVGLFYDSASLEGAWQVVKDWTGAEREALRAAVPVHGLKSTIHGRSVREIGRDIVALAREGLARRSYLNGEGLDETIFLSSIEEVLASGMTPADQIMREYERDWHGDIDRIFEAHAY
jgi:glutamate--cysteine ligase